MDNEPYRDLSHLELIATVSDWLRSQGNQVTNEHVLPDGKRADIIYSTTEGAIHIVECKLIQTDPLIVAAYEKYYKFCNALWLASNTRSRLTPLGVYSLPNYRAALDKVGLLHVARCAVAVGQEAVGHTLDRLTGDRVRSTLPQG